MTPCERCGAPSPFAVTDSYDLHDYCAVCSKNLCAPCMAKGCCGNEPVKSGQGEDSGQSEDE